MSSKRGELTWITFIGTISQTSQTKQTNQSMQRSTDLADESVMGTANPGNALETKESNQ